MLVPVAAGDVKVDNINKPVTFPNSKWTPTRGKYRRSTHACEPILNAHPIRLWKNLSCRSRKGVWETIVDAVSS